MSFPALLLASALLAVSLAPARAEGLLGPAKPYAPPVPPAPAGPLVIQPEDGGAPVPTTFEQLRVRKEPPPPAYPEFARQAGIHGTVIVRVTLDRAGVPVRAETAEGPPQLRAAAERHAMAALEGQDPDLPHQAAELILKPVLDDPSAVAALTDANPQTGPGPAPPERRISPPGAGLAGDGAQAQPGAKPIDFDFSQITITHQPSPPPYPSLALAYRVQGVVVVELVVDVNGRPIRALALEGPLMLATAAVAYAMDWRFQPARLNGTAMQARFRLTMPFKLR